jgi:signal transduction histidine kinase
MFTSSPCLISIRRLKDLKYIDVNETWKSFTGFGDEVIGMVGDLLKISADPETGEHYTPGMVQRNLKIKYITRNNQLRDGLLSSEIIELDDGKCLLNVIVDVTDKARYEKEMIRLGQLNLVGEMAAGIAHEIRNPMTTIRGFLQMSQRNEKGIPSEYIDIMLGELDRANGIISEYLSLAKNKSSHLEAKALNPIIESIFPLLQAEAMMSGKNVRIDYGADGHLLLDEKEIRQMILNFAINGLEAMISGGMLTIRTYMEQMETVLEISDQGSGIRTEYLDKLGTPFFTTKEKGTGLGLAVCYSIAVRHHATIDVKSSPEGTTFFIRFRGA